MAVHKIKKEVFASCFFTFYQGQMSAFVLHREIVGVPKDVLARAQKEQSLAQKQLKHNLLFFFLLNGEKYQENP